MNVNGEMTIVNYEFLNNLYKGGYVMTEIRMKSISRVGNYSTRNLFGSYDEFLAVFNPIIKDPKYALYDGDYPFIESMNISYPQLGFPNQYRCYDIIGKRKIIENIAYTSNTQSSIPLDQRERAKYLNAQAVQTVNRNLNTEFDKYQTNITNKYNEVLAYYVERGYVDDGYMEYKSNITTN